MRGQQLRRVAAPRRNAVAWRSSRRPATVKVTAQLIIFRSEVRAARTRARAPLPACLTPACHRHRHQDVKVDKFLGTMSYMSVFSSTPNSTAGAVRSLDNLSRLSAPSTSQSAFDTRLYTGRIEQGALTGTSVMLKAYPPGQLQDADMLAANELATHVMLQDALTGGQCSCIVELLGGLLVQSGANAGEQWLVYRNNGTVTVDMYCQIAARATMQGTAVAPGEVAPDWMDSMDPSRTLRRRKKYILRMMRQVLRGLSFMHTRQRAHGSLGPASVIINTANELLVERLQARLKDLAFAVDFSDSALWGGATLAELWEGRDYNGRQDFRKSIAERLWLQAGQQGAWTEVDKRNFAIADDIYSAGLLLLYCCLAPLAPPGATSVPDLQRLLEGSFSGQVEGLREYLKEDERFVLGVDFLDAGGGAGWELVQAMVQPKWRRRPTSESCLVHPFLTGEAFDSDSQSVSAYTTPASD